MEEMRIVLGQERRLRRLCTALFWLKRIGFWGTDDHSLLLVQPVVTTDTKDGCFFITKPTRSIQGTTDGILPKFWSRKGRYQLNYQASHSKSTTWWLHVCSSFLHIFSSGCWQSQTVILLMRMFWNNKKRMIGTWKVGWFTKPPV